MTLVHRRVDLGRVPDHLHVVDAALSNWAAWSKDPKRRAGSTVLGDRFHHSDYDEPEPEDAPIPSMEIIRQRSTSGLKPMQHLALRTQDAVMGLPNPTHRLLLHYWYIHKTHPRFIRRKLGYATDELLYTTLNSVRAAVQAAGGA